MRALLFCALLGLAAATCPCANCPTAPGPHGGACCHGNKQCEQTNWVPPGSSAPGTQCTAAYGTWCPWTPPGRCGYACKDSNCGKCVSFSSSAYCQASKTNCERDCKGTFCANGDDAEKKPRAAFVNCGNGNFCRPDEKCVTSEAGAGRKWGCAPKNATVCKYPRFSCPATHSACQFKDAKCANAAGETVAATENSKALGHAQMRAAKKAAKKQGVLRGLFDDDKTDDDGKDDDKSDDDAGGDDDSAAGPICSVFNDDLPSFCHCADVGGGADAKCTIDFLDIDSVVFEADLEPCNLKGSISVTETDMGVAWSEGFGVDESIDIPIPGLSIDVPLVGSVGAVAKASVSGTVTSATFSIGLDACLGDANECGSDIPVIGHYLPYTILDETYDFGNVCSKQTTPALQSVPCKNSEGKCVNPKTQACYDYICAGPVDPKTSKCPSFTNVCPCGTNYNDDTKDDGSKACCGIGCPTHRNLNFLRGATVATE